MPSHTHTVRAAIDPADLQAPGNQRSMARSGLGDAWGPANNLTTMAAQITQNSGGSQAHNNLQPFIAMNFIIALGRPLSLAELGGGPWLSTFPRSRRLSTLRLCSKSKATKTPPRLTVRLTLANTSDQQIILHSAGRGTELFWHLLDETDHEVIRQDPAKAAATSRGYRSLTLAPGAEWHDTVNLTLKTKPLETGKVYQLRTRFWGQVAEDDFTIVKRMPLAKLKPAKKAAPKKKAPAKKAPAKKAPVKKAAAKKAPAKKAAAKKAPAKKK